MNENRFTPASFAKFIVREMRKGKVKISDFSKFSGIPKYRIREIRATGRAKNQGEWILTLRECIAAKAS